MVVSYLGIFVSLIPLFAWGLSHIKVSDLLLLSGGAYGLIKEVRKLTGLNK